MTPGNTVLRALILAGGEGTRLRALTRSISGDDRPKQFCRLLGGDTLLEQTLKRVELLIPSEDTTLIITRGQEQYLADSRTDSREAELLIQPYNRGTAPAVLYGLVRASQSGPDTTVAIFPSDHYVSDPAVFMKQVETACAAVQSAPEIVVLLGIRPRTIETAYGWIEPGEPFCDSPARLFHVRSFHEKPCAGVATQLWSRGALWNSFVIVANTATLLRLIQNASPQLYRLFESVHTSRSAEEEAVRVQTVYAGLPAIDLSRTVLGNAVSELAVMRVEGVDWSDIGDPQRVLCALRQIGFRPDRLELVRSADVEAVELRGSRLSPNTFRILYREPKLERRPR